MTYLLHRPSVPKRARTVSGATKGVGSEKPEARGGGGGTPCHGPEGSGFKRPTGLALGGAGAVDHDGAGLARLVGGDEALRVDQEVECVRDDVGDTAEVEAAECVEEVHEVLSFRSGVMSGVHGCAAARRRRSW